MITLYRPGVNNQGHPGSEHDNLSRPEWWTPAPQTMSTPIPPTEGERWPLAAVLVVDDEPGMRHFLERTLQPRVGHVASAASAEDAGELLGDTPHLQIGHGCLSLRREREAALSPPAPEMSAASC